MQSRKGLQIFREKLVGMHDGFWKFFMLKFVVGRNHGDIARNFIQLEFPYSFAAENIDISRYYNYRTSIVIPLLQFISAYVFWIFDSINIGCFLILSFDFKFLNSEVGLN